MSGSLPLQDKTIVIVGALGVIGREVVKATMGAGANVVALDCNAEGMDGLRESTAGSVGRLQFGKVDISDRSSIEQALASTEEEFGGLDGAVNTAYPRGPRYGRHFFDVDRADFCENISLHLGGYFLFMQACARYALDRSRSFSLVNVSSIYGSMVPQFSIYSGTTMTMPVEYAAIKAGLEHMTRYVCAYMKGRSACFRANCVSPGGILAGQDDRFLAQYSERCVSKGMLDAADVTGAIVFLLSDASRYLVGQNLIVDDGFST
jgi:NAD(P)-dependent dehydrogenase (short-subunit alcohol dehydrogenase family)